MADADDLSSGATSRADTIQSTYVQLAGAGDRRGALDVALEWAQRTSPISVITDVLVPSQVEVGRRWQTGTWTVAEEHVATGVTDYVLAVFSDHHPVEVTQPGAVAVVCAEGEWHSVAAHLVAELLRLAGWQIETLGASTPGVDLAAHLLKTNTVAVAAHCSMTSNLAGLLRTIEAAHGSGVPVVAGGRAVTPARAERLGADACRTGSSLSEVSELLRQWSEAPPQLASGVSLGSAYYQLEAQRSDLVDQAMLGVFHQLPVLAALNAAQIRDLREEIDRLVRFLAATLLVDERSILLEECHWLGQVFVSRGFPDRLIAVTADSLLDAIDSGGGDPMPDAHTALREVIRQSRA